MNVGGLIGEQLPVFFILALGYVAGKRHTSDANQAAGFSKLALGFALPAVLFVSMIDIRRDFLLQQGSLVLALLLAHLRLFLIALVVLQRIESLKGTGAILCALTVSLLVTVSLTIAIGR